MPSTMSSSEPTIRSSQRRQLPTRRMECMRVMQGICLKVINCNNLRGMKQAGMIVWSALASVDSSPFWSTSRRLSVKVNR